MTTSSSSSMVSRGIQANRRVSSIFQLSGTIPAAQDLPVRGSADFDLLAATSARCSLSKPCSAVLSSLKSWNCERGGCGSGGEASGRVCEMLVLPASLNLKS